ncbi:MAG: lysophospholipid acyltransferase family protein, partial [Bacteroidota bacterium]
LILVKQIYNEIYQLQGLDFIDAFMKRMEIEVHWEGNGLEKIPQEGAFVTVCNHPFGAWDGLLLIHMMVQRRPDFKVMANFLLQQVSPLESFFIPVNPLDENLAAKSSIGGMKQALTHLKEGHPLGIFPAGEVSSFQPKARTITDRAWQRPALKLIEKAQVPVIPIHFQGTNSPIFQLMGMIHPVLRTARLPKETLNKKRTRIHAQVGSPISIIEQKRIEETDRLGRYLRARVYSLGSGLPVERFFKRRLSFPKKASPIAQPTSRDLLEQDISRLREDQKLCSQMEFDVFLAPAAQIPHVLKEIGRLREITFREVGEGTGQASDLDEYDLYYLHLFLYDREAGRIAGAYRLGRGDEILLKYGKKGFYTYSLFKMKPDLEPVLRRSVELGRSFILKEYQRKRLSLFLLWKGIHTFLVSQEQFGYLIGPVTISNDYSTLSKSLIVALIERFFFDHELSPYVEPRKPFKPKLKQVNPDDLLAAVADAKDLKQVDKVLEYIEPYHFKLPILLKKYIKQNARIVAFNVDPSFNNALDGLMILDLKELPEATHENMS